MPIITLSGIETENILKVKEKMIQLIINEMDIDEENITILLDKREFITSPYVFISIEWFDRGQQIKDNTAKGINEILKEIGIESADIWFTKLERDSYYENGEHF
jgi:glutaredoxin